MTELGFWKSEPFIEAANILVAADEPLRALHLLENLPGYYRDHIPKEIFQLKRDILKQIATNTFYALEPDSELPDPDNFLHHHGHILRWNLIKKDVEEFNKRGLIPHILDIGPGSFWLLACLDYLELGFTYNDISMSSKIQDRAKEKYKHRYLIEPPTNQPHIVFACELIEHLHHETDILAEIMRAKVNPHIIHVSTPKYSYDCRPEKLNWKEHGDLGHLRTYTPAEFMMKIHNMFPDYEKYFHDGQIMHVQLVKKS